MELIINIGMLSETFILNNNKNLEQLKINLQISVYLRLNLISNTISFEYRDQIKNNRQ